MTGKSKGNTGGAYKIALRSTAADLQSLAQIPRGTQARLVTILAPGPGDDPTPNTGVVLVGHNGMAVFPLRPGASLDISDCDPSTIAIDPQNVAGQKVFVSVGGTPLVITQPLA